MTARAESQYDHGISIKEIERTEGKELFATTPPAKGRELSETLDALGIAGAESVVGGEMFAPHTSLSALDGFSGPLTCVLPDAAGPGLGGAHIHAVTGVRVERINSGGRVVGTVVHGAYASECLLAGLYADDTFASREEQARATFEAIDSALHAVGMDFSNVVRTWLFLDDILDCYAQFNAVRTAYFEEHGVFDRLVPASTGIGGANPAGAAMTVGAWAVGPHDPRVKVQALPSPLQCPALDYGSSFSRAAEVEMPDLRRVFVSGTASIGPDGRTRHAGDVRGQTALTCEVVEAILQSRGMGWEDVTRATAYVRHRGDAGVFAQHCEASGMPVLPAVVAHNTICRDDLLFELEADAVQAR